MSSEGHVSLWRAGASVHLLAPWAGPSVPRTVPGIQMTLRRCLLNELLSLNFLKSINARNNVLLLYLNFALWMTSLIPLPIYFLVGLPPVSPGCNPFLAPMLFQHALQSSKEKPLKSSVHTSDRCACPCLSDRGSSFTPRPRPQEATWGNGGRTLISRGGGRLS